MRTFLASANRPGRRRVLVATSAIVILGAAAAVAGVALNFETPRARRALVYQVATSDHPPSLGFSNSSNQCAWKRETFGSTTIEALETSGISWCKWDPSGAATSTTKKGVCMVDDDRRRVLFMERADGSGGTLSSITKRVAYQSNWLLGLDDEGRDDGFEAVACDADECWVMLETDKTGGKNITVGGDKCRSILYKTQPFALRFPNGTSQTDKNQTQSPDVIQLLWEDASGNQVAGCVPPLEVFSRLSASDTGGDCTVSCGGGNACTSDDQCPAYTEPSTGRVYPLECDRPCMDATHPWVACTAPDTQACKKVTTGQCVLKKGDIESGGNGVTLMRNGHVIVTQSGGPHGLTLTEFAPSTDAVARGYTWNEGSNNSPVRAFSSNTAISQFVKPATSKYIVVAQWKEQGGSYFSIGGDSASYASTGPVMRFAGQGACSGKFHWYPAHGHGNEVTPFVVKDAANSSTLGGGLLVQTSSCRNLFEVGDLSPLHDYFSARRIVAAIKPSTNPRPCTGTGDCNRDAGERCVNGSCLPGLPLSGGGAILDRTSNTGLTNYTRRFHPLVVHDGNPTDPVFNDLGQSGCDPTLGKVWCHKDDVMELAEHQLATRDAGRTCATSGSVCNAATATAGSGTGETCYCDYGCYQRGDCCLRVNEGCSHPAPGSLVAGYDSTVVRCTARAGFHSSKAWGDGRNGALGTGDSISSKIPVNVSIQAPWESFLPRNTVAFAGHLSQTLCSLEGREQRVVCMGRDDYGQTGRGSGGGEDGGPHTNAQVVMRLHPTTLGTYELKEVSQVDVGLHHACAVVGSDRRVYCWGRNDYGALGRGHTLTRWEETLAHYPVDKASGGVLTGVVEVAVGGYHTCARTTDARVYCWGWQGEGRLGNGAHAYVAQATALEVSTTFARVRKLSLGTNHSCAIAAQAGATSDSVYCWGYGASGQVGGSTVAVNTSLVRVFQSSGAVTDLSAGDSTTCAIDAGALKCWGANDRGQLGIGATGAGNATPQTIGTASDNASIGPTGTYQPRQVSVGRAHACGLFHSASGVKVMCWGSNASWDGVATGQVGNNSTANATRPQTSISRSICVQ